MELEELYELGRKGKPMIMRIVMLGGKIGLPERYDHIAFYNDGKCFIAMDDNDGPHMYGSCDGVIFEPDRELTREEKILWAVCGFIGGEFRYGKSLSMVRVAYVYDKEMEKVIEEASKMGEDELREKAIACSKEKDKVSWQADEESAKAAARVYGFIEAYNVSIGKTQWQSIDDSPLE